MEEVKKKRKLVNKLKNKYRLVILNDETFEERASFRLSRFNVYVIVSTLLMLMVVIIFSVVVFTPLKEYIPGYGDVNLRKDIVALSLESDSLELIVEQQNKWIRNIKNILEGSIDTTQWIAGNQGKKYDTIRLDQIPYEDAMLRQQMEQEENYALVFSKKMSERRMTLSNLSLTPPLKGYITAAFNPDEDHYGIDVVAQEKEPVLCILDGTVILASWTLETGYVIGIQHEYNLISFYKHNAVLLKKVGNFVKAGDAIAIIGSSGEQSSGPHLHFELWSEGVPVNPEDFIAF